MEKNISDEYQSENTEIERFKEYISLPYKLYNDAEIFTDYDYIRLYKYIMNLFKTTVEGFDIKDPIFEVRDYLETFTCVQEYLCTMGDERKESRSDEEVIEDILRLLRERKKDKKNPIRKLFRAIKG
jgi:hypothetical protein